MTSQPVFDMTEAQYTLSHVLVLDAVNDPVAAGVRIGATYSQTFNPC